MWFSIIIKITVYLFPWPCMTGTLGGDPMQLTTRSNPRTNLFTVFNPLSAEACTIVGTLKSQKLFTVFNSFSAGACMIEGTLKSQNLFKVFNPFSAEECAIVGTLKSQNWLTVFNPFSAEVCGAQAVCPALRLLAVVLRISGCFAGSQTSPVYITNILTGFRHVLNWICHKA